MWTVRKSAISHLLFEAHILWNLQGKNLMKSDQIILHSLLSAPHQTSNFRHMEECMFGTSVKDHRR